MENDVNDVNDVNITSQNIRLRYAMSRCWNRGKLINSAIFENVTLNLDPFSMIPISNIPSFRPKCTSTAKIHDKLTKFEYDRIFKDSDKKYAKQSHAWIWRRSWKMYVCSSKLILLLEYVLTTFQWLWLAYIFQCAHGRLFSMPHLKIGMFLLKENTLVCKSSMCTAQCKLHNAHYAHSFKYSSEFECSLVVFSISFDKNPVWI